MKKIDIVAIVALAFVAGIMLGKRSNVQEPDVGFDEAQIKASVDSIVQQEVDRLDSIMLKRAERMDSVIKAGAENLSSMRYSLSALVESKSGQIPNGEFMELKDLLKAIAVPKSERRSSPSTLLLAKAGSKVHWASRNFNYTQDWWLSPHFAKVDEDAAHGGLVERTGFVNVRVNGEFTSNTLDGVVRDVPWTIGLAGNRYWGTVYAVYLVEHNEGNATGSGYFMDYLESLGWLKSAESPMPEDQDCMPNWYEVNIPGYKTMWMLKGTFGGNAPSTEYFTFVYNDVKKVMEVEACPLLRKWENNHRK